MAIPAVDRSNAMNMRSPARYDFSLRPNLSTARMEFGPEREPVLVIDDVLTQPRSMTAFASREVEFTPAWTTDGGYPGIRAQAPLSYVNNLAAMAAPVVVDNFQLQRVSLQHASCWLSLVTLRPDKLALLHRIPHIDTVNPLRFALLHYFCGSDQGGTAFYCHRNTGLSTIDAGQEHRYLTSRDEELSSDPPPPRYIDGDTSAFEQTGRVQARFNRLVIYRSCHLHSGVIPRSMNFSSDPAEGRLTANVFLNFQRCLN